MQRRNWARIEQRVKAALVLLFTGELLAALLLFGPDARVIEYLGYVAGAVVLVCGILWEQPRRH